MTTKTLDLDLNFDNVPTESVDLFLMEGSRAMPEFAASTSSDPDEESKLAESCGTCISSCGTCFSCTT